MMKIRIVLSGMMIAAGLAATAASAQSAYPDFAIPRLEGVTVPGLPAITSRFHVDQLGYRPSFDKVAVISDPQRGYNAAESYTPGPVIEVREKATGKVVFSGAPKLWRNGAIHEDSGDRGWWFDFSAVRTEGEYYLFDPSTQLRSAVFRVADDVYAEVLRAALRTYFYQRLGTPLEAPYAEAPWTEPAAKLQDRHTRAVWARDDASTERDLSGGWMDAGDVNKYPPFNGEVIHPLLYAYRANPAAFPDGQLNIPESGNGLPDLLDELKYQLDWLIRMQEPDGGVWVKMGEIDYNGRWPIHTDLRPRFYGPKCTGAAIYTASFFAHAARVYAQFEPWKTYAQDLNRRALLSWDYYQNNPKTPRSDDGTIKSGIASRDEADQARMEAFAAVHLFALTGEDRFHDAIKRRAPQTRQLSEGYWSPYEARAAEALLDYATLPNADPALTARIRQQLATSAANPSWAFPGDADLYRAGMNPNAYHWGSNSMRATYGIIALNAAQHAGLPPADQTRLRQRAMDLLHSFHGVNPLTVVYLSNMGSLGAENSVQRIYHSRYNFGTPFEANPPPGYLVGGPNQNFGGSNGDTPGDVQWIKTQPRAKAYADYNHGWPKASWELSEPAIYYQASYIRLLTECVPGAESPR
jgi:hypothetical protein